jgi:uracil-DNA glycosylase
MDKGKKLEEIAREIENCKVCKIKKSGKAVPGEGNSNICFAMP